jgi:hypothetical protein
VALLMIVGNKTEGSCQSNAKSVSIAARRGEHWYDKGMKSHG